MRSPNALAQRHVMQGKAVAMLGGTLIERTKVVVVVLEIIA